MFFPRGLSRAVAGAALILSFASPGWAQAGDVLTLPEALAPVAFAEAQASPPYQAMRRDRESRRSEPIGSQ